MAAIEKRQEHLDLWQFFAGEVEAFGYVEDLRRRLKMRFSGQFTGHLRNDGALVIHEYLAYDNGEVEDREWFVLPAVDVERWDVEGVALVRPGIIERIAVDAVCWRYAIPLKLKHMALQVDCEDIMVAVGDGVVASHARLTKLGLPLASIHTAYVRRGQRAVAA